MRLLFAAAFGCLVASTAVAQDAPASAAAPEAKPEKKICRRQEITGSILGGKPVCHTKTEWAQIDANNRASVDLAVSRAQDNQDTSVRPPN